jgi:hypothetical protein
MRMTMLDGVCMMSNCSELEAIAEIVDMLDADAVCIKGMLD